MTIFVFVLLCLIWGSTWIFIKIGLTDAPPLYSAGFRFLIAVAILYAIVFTKGYRLPRTLRGFLRLGYPGFYLFGISYALIYIGENYISSALTSIIFAAFPLLVALLATWMLAVERLHFWGWLGLAVGIVGIVVISYDSMTTSANVLLGTALALLGTVASAYGTLLHKRRFSKENVIVATSVQMTIGGLPLLAVAAVSERLDTFTVSWASVGSILYLSILGTVIAFNGWYWLLGRVTAVQASLVAFLTPAVAVFIGVGFFEESLTVPIVLGTMMILSGVFLVSRKPVDKPNVPASETSGDLTTI
jgi:drug/metabolite transporter (DMT)-like permease